jgi:hypothetical protein
MTTSAFRWMLSLTLELDLCLFGMNSVTSLETFF